MRSPAQRCLMVAALGLASSGSLAAQAIPPAGSVAEQRRWLLEQVQLGQSSGRQPLVEDALARLAMLAPDDPATLLALLEVQLSVQKVDDAGATLLRLRRLARGRTELIAAERLWHAYRGGNQQDLQQARMLATGGRDAEALAIYRRLFNDQPPGLQLGIEYWRLRGREPAGRDLALRRLAELEREYPGNTAVLELQSRLLFAAGRDAEALAVLRRMQANPAARDAAAQAQWDYLSNQAPSERNLARLREFIDAHPAWPQLADARSRYEADRTRFDHPGWRAGQRGNRLLEAGRHAEAERAFREAVSGQPGTSDWHGGLGMALMRQGKREAAIVEFEQALRHLPPGESGGKWRSLITSTRYWLRMEQAEKALAAGELDRAESLYAASRREDPREVNAVLGLADVALARHDDAGAERLLREARRIDPADSNALRKLLALLARTEPERLESTVGGLSPAERSRHAELIRAARIARMEARLAQAREDLQQGRGDPETVIALGQALRKETPEDPWLAFRLAGDLREAGRAAEAEAVIDDMVRQAGNTPDARYAQALFLSSLDRAGDALAALAEVPASAWSEGMHELSRRLQREQLWARLRALREAGREAEAIALLEQQPDGVDKHLALADWARDRGDHPTALAGYERVLAEEPGHVDAGLGRIETLVALGRPDEARRALTDFDRPTEDARVQRRLADAWLALGEEARAREIMRSVVARLVGPDAHLRRDLARLNRSIDSEAALDMYALAMRDAGLLEPAQAEPRDNRALTRASRERAGDDWLAGSLRSDVDRYYQFRNPALTLMQDTSRRSDGTPGFSQLRRDTRIADFSMPLGAGRGWARLEQITLDAGRFTVDANGGHRQDFGSCGVSLLEADGSRYLPPPCIRDIHQRQVSGAGLAVGWNREDGRLSFDIGRTPAGLVAANWVGGATIGGDLGLLGWSATLSRRPMTNSLLSQAGAIDPRSGTRWGGVLAEGLTMSLGYDKGGRNGIWSNWGMHRVGGENVADNDRIRAMVGWYHKLVQKPDMRLDVGLTGMYWRYRHDLGGYSLGQGGYYSPQQYGSLGVPVSFAWRNADWSVRLDGSVSWSRARTDASDRYPLVPLIERVVAEIAAAEGRPLVFDAAGSRSAGGRSSGTGYRVYAAVERRLGDHFVLGAATTLQRSRDYSPDSFQLYLRYVFRPWQGNLPLPVAPLSPYGEFR